MPKSLLRIAGREFAAFFASPVAYLFLGVFLAVSLFVFFWLETFFARNVADLRPLFEWMPLLLIFLVAALTMRLWAEERRAGTLELLLTSPTPLWQWVLGKFLAAWALVALALALTLALPVTVSLLGPLDWGPVIGGYLAALLLAAAYVSIGLFVSALTDNQIISLIGTVVLCGLFYLLGSEGLTALFGNRASEWLQLLGTGSRFDAITRGVIDLRDLYYYLSLAGVFLALNVYTLERLRWAPDGDHAHHGRWRALLGLLVANLLIANVWLYPLGSARLDLTEGKVYSISDTTREYLGQLEEPLRIRGYFSAQTHPLLAPLVPQLRDLLAEYREASGGRLRVEILDPQQDPEVEREAGEEYDVKPVPFQVSSKYQAAVVNSYFDLVVQYGDQFEKLGFQELIEVKLNDYDDIDVRLRNPEYDLTRAIKKVLRAYRAGGNPFTAIQSPVVFHGYISDQVTLPEPLRPVRAELTALLDEYKQQAGKQLLIDIRDPAVGDGALAKDIRERYGFRPFTLSLLDPNSFYFYMVLESDGQLVQVPLPQSPDRASLKRAIDAGLKRFSAGLLRTLAVHAPKDISPMGIPRDAYRLLIDRLSQNAALKHTDLKSGLVPDEADLLLVVDPKGFDDKQRFAVDQFLMQGGTVVIAASPFRLDLGGSSIGAEVQATGLEEWLAHHGLSLQKSLLMDPQNTPLSVPVERRIGAYVVQEVRSLPYPYFPDIREDGMAEHPVTAGLGQLTLTWASPIDVDSDQNKDRQLTALLRSSPGSWLREDTNIQPDFQRYPQRGFAPGESAGQQPLAVMLEGRFDSFYADRPSPLIETSEGEKQAEGAEAEDKPEPVIAGVIASSPPSARIILLGSGTALSDAALSLAQESTGTRYDKPLELLDNLLDWSLEDRGLLSLRGRGQFARMLLPLDQETSLFWEYLNYGLALAGLLLVWWVNRQAVKRRRERHARILAGEEA